jgi:Flp pilus assembly protein TadD
MSASWETQLTPEAARKLLSGDTPLREAMGVPLSELMFMASRAYDLWRQGRRDDAETLYRGIVALDAGVPWGHAGLGLAAMEEGKLEAAEGHLRKAVAADPTDPSIQVNLAECLIRRDQLLAALEILKAVVENPEHASHPGSVRAAVILTGIGHGLSALLPS